MKTLTEEELEGEFIAEHHNAWDKHRITLKPFTPHREFGPRRYICVKDLGNGMIEVEPIGGGERLVGPKSDFHT